MAESGLEETLTKGKIGGVPVWAAGIGLAAVIIGYNYFRNRGSGPSPSSGTIEMVEAEPSEEDGLPDGPIGDWLRENPTYGGYPGIGFTPGNISAPISNAQWVRLVSDELLATGADPALVSNALYKYLAGQPLTESEQAIINKALRLIGLPPDGIIPVNPVTPPPPAPGPKPYVLYYWADGTSAEWGLVGGTEKWQETRSQAQANAWAVKYMPSRNAIRLSKEAFEAKKMEALGGG